MKLSQVPRPSPPLPVVPVPVAVLLLLAALLLGRSHPASAETAASKAAASCGGGRCSRPVQNAHALELCLRDAFSAAPPKRNGVPAATFPEDGGDYDEARKTWRGRRYPAAVVYARSVAEVQAAVRCAGDSGHRVSARGHGHSGQGLAVVSGYVVVDVSLMCTPESFEVDRGRNGGHILPGSKYIATMKVSAGCTNAAVISALHTEFAAEERALAVTGGWPSVGVGGFTLGGGSGDLTPYAGYAIDVLEAVDLVLADGTAVTATEGNERSDLFWASRGGGGGLGVVTHYTYKVIQNPDEDGRITRLTIRYNLTDSGARERLTNNLNRFLYHEDVEKTKLYGGIGSFSPPAIECAMEALCSYLELQYLGGWEAALDGLRDLQLLGQENIPLASVPSKLMKDFEVQCIGEECDEINLPGMGVDVSETKGLSEGYFEKASCSLNLAGMVGSSGYVCEDLGINDTLYCENVAEVVPGSTVIRQIVCPSSKTPYSQQYAKSLSAELIEVAKDPESTMNSVGFSRKYIADMAAIGESVPSEVLKKHTNTGGLLIPELSDETMNKLTNYGLFITHFQHGAPMQIDGNATALPWRNAAIMSSNTHPYDGVLEPIDAQIRIIAEEDPAKVQGYYNNLAPIGTPDWKRLYFGDNYRMLAEIKAKYDPYESFSKPMGVELPEEDGYCDWDGASPMTMASAALGHAALSGGFVYYLGFALLGLLVI